MGAALAIKHTIHTDMNTEAGGPEDTHTHTPQSRVFVVVIEVDPQQEVLQMGLIAFIHQFGHHCRKQTYTELFNSG